MQDANFPTLEEVKQMIANLPRNITLKDMAKACDVSASWLSEVISGETPNPSYERIVRIVRYLRSYNR